MRIAKTILLLAAAFWLTACDGGDDDFVAPAFLHIESIKVVPPASNVITSDSGFYRSEIVSCNVTLRYPDSRELVTLGHFDLPFTVPLLHDGPIREIQVYPCVKQSGNSRTQPFYTFYNAITLNKHSFRMGGVDYSDTLFSRSGDTLDLGPLTTTYNITRANVLMFEPFEPTQGSLFLDSVVWHRHAAGDACSGEGYASVHVPDSLSRVPFYINRDFYVNDPTKIIYVELDHRSDIPFELYMHSSQDSNATVNQRGVMVINPSQKWQHMYINLGRTWNWFAHYPHFKLSFAALNAKGQEGEVRIDNIKVITTNVVL